MKAFSVRWTGTLTPPGPGDYTFGIHQPDCYPCEDHEAFHVYLDGKPVLSSTGFNRKPGPGTFKVHFNDTQPHSHPARLLAPFSAVRRRGHAQLESSR